MRGAAPWLVMVLISGSVAAEPFLQYQVDAHRSGFTTDAGPAVDDVAFRLSIPGAPPAWANPVILADSVYLLRTEPSGDSIWQIELGTAVAKRLVQLPGTWPANGLASNGELLFTTHEARLLAYRLDGTLAWSQLLAPQALQALIGSGFGPYDGCLPPLVEPGRVVVACRHQFAGPTDVIVWASDFQGEALWEQPWRYSAAVAGGDVPVSSGIYPVTLAAGPQGYWLGVADHATDWAFVATAIVSQEGQTIDAWTTIRTGDVSSDGRVAQSSRMPPSFAFAGSNEEMFAASLDTWRWQDLPATNKDWAFDLGARSQPGISEPPRGLAVGDTQLFVTSDDALWRIDTNTRAAGWLAPAPLGGPDGRSGVLVAGDRVYAPETGNVRIPTIRAFDRETGDAVAAWPSGQGSASALEGPFAPGITFAIGEGVLVIHSAEFVTIVGSTGASIQVDARLPPFPQPGQAVALDLSGTIDGALSNDTEFRIDWGDGTVTPWSSSRAVSQTYERGEFSIVVRARNPAGQEAHLVVPVEIGASPPKDPTFLETRFAAENQETTFFVLGLIITAIAAAIGAVRLGRKRARLRHELDAVDQIAAEHASPMALHHAMVDRKEHAKTLLIAGKLDESQFAVLERHIDNRAAGGRLTSIEQDFPFLPMSLGATLQRMLDDGVISGPERETFLAALGADQVLTKAQKSKVAGRIEAWFAEDA